MKQITSLFLLVLFTFAFQTTHGAAIEKMCEVHQKRLNHQAGIAYRVRTNPQEINIFRQQHMRQNDILEADINLNCSTSSLYAQYTYTTYNDNHEPIFQTSPLKISYSSYNPASNYLQFKLEGMNPKTKEYDVIRANLHVIIGYAVTVSDVDQMQEVLNNPQDFNVPYAKTCSDMYNGVAQPCRPFILYFQSQNDIPANFKADQIYGYRFYYTPTYMGSSVTIPDEDYSWMTINGKEYDDQFYYVENGGLNIDPFLTNLYGLTHDVIHSEESNTLLDYQLGDAKMIMSQLFNN